MPSMTPCCGTSVGVIVTDAAGRLLMIERGWYPVGIAPVAGHIADAHTDAAAAVVAEVSEEVGLTVTAHTVVADGFWLPNLCASPPSAIPGHRWTLVTAAVTGELAPDPVETKGARWYTPGQVEVLAGRTLALARGDISDADYAFEPGLEPVWLELLHRAKVRSALSGELTAARRLYTTPPECYWDADRGVEVPAEQAAATLNA
ncbi:NUDIX domain-containing protein [Murinocardiopsis flavida]|uniref:NUDIX domain-containing protein n=1 Tax=Murinocardiopsis flavida TaxID=645275 RepID=A0A2P8DFQ9_9ACTN|nr:NUDIX domain-containing protein [Murinocardiopsis flavida]PSK96039.1 NUDIX domain-containing protein [Murinocardiopsis flavida]